MNIDKNLISHWAYIFESEKANLPQESGEEQVAEAGQSPADILGNWKAKKDVEDKKAAEEQAKKDAERKANAVKEITITKLHEDGSIDYTVVYNNGKTSNEKWDAIPDDDETFVKTRRMLKQMAQKGDDGKKKVVTDDDVQLAMMRMCFNRWAVLPIEWKYVNGFKDQEGSLDDDWYYRPSEDYLGNTPDFVQSIYDAGGRIPGMM